MMVEDRATANGQVWCQLVSLAARNGDSQQAQMYYDHMLSRWEHRLTVMLNPGAINAAGPWCCPVLCTLRRIWASFQGGMGGHTAAP